MKNLLNGRQIHMPKTIVPLKKGVRASSEVLVGTIQQSKVGLTLREGQIREVRPNPCILNREKPSLVVLNNPVREPNNTQIEGVQASYTVSLETSGRIKEMVQA
jgi:hypothetical protein